MISNDKIFEYEKILGLRADRRGQDRRKKQSLEARADAFLRLTEAGAYPQLPTLPKFF